MLPFSGMCMGEILSQKWDQWAASSILFFGLNDSMLTIYENTHLPTDKRPHV
jgi:putative Mn2+ efflux pump MntP